MAKVNFSDFIGLPAVKLSDVVNKTPDQMRNMTRDELFLSVLALSRSVNRAYNDMLRSPYADVSSVRALERTGGRLSVMEQDASGKSTGVVKDRNQLLHELKRGLRYYKSQTSSVSKMNQIMRTTEQRLSTQFGRKVKFESLYKDGQRITPQERFADFWSLFDRLMERQQLSGFVFDSGEAQEFAYDLIENGTLPQDVDAIEETINRMRGIYEERELEETRKREERRARYGGPSQVFSGNR